MSAAGRSPREAVVRARDLVFGYRQGDTRVDVLKGVSFDIARGEFVAIVGPSGSGKSTLFYLLGCLMAPTSGRIELAGVDVGRLDADRRAYLRNERIGFVFQQFHLLARANVLENILLPASYPCERAPADRAALEARARELADRLGLGAHLHHLPNQLSGGQQQRVAIARALLKDVDLILADEPTGNLDSKTAAATLELLRELNRQGKTIVLITHDAGVAEQCDRSIVVKDGLIEKGSGHFSEGAASSQSPSTTQRLQKSDLTPFFALYRTLRSVLPLAWENLFRNRMKSFLTMLGVIVGVSAVLAMVTFARYTERRIMDSFVELGANKIMVYGWRNWNASASSQSAAVFSEFSLARDIEPLKRVFPDVVDYTPTLSAWGQYVVTYSGREVNQNVRPMGVGPSYLRISSRELVAGAAISPFHVESRSPVCLLGWEIAKRLFTGVSTPLGETVFVTSDQMPTFSCRVIGVLASQVTNSDWNKPDTQILMPYTYFQSIAPYWYTQMDRVALETTPAADGETLAAAIKRYFERKYGDTGRFNIGSDAVMQAQIRKFLALFSIMITSIALITLAVGGMGINNMMLVSVNERLKEIGIRKAVGATDRSVRVQLLLESTLLCAIAGAIGITIGFAAYEGIIFVAAKFVSRLKFEWIVEPWAVGLANACILAVGILSGITPALKAERLQVIEALRSE